jgi:hypothetical protein
LGGRGIVKEKPDDDEIPNYITELNTVIAKQENSSYKRTISRLRTNKQVPVINNLRYFILFNILSILLIHHINFLTKYSSGGAL